jgi:hypothetical protein
VQSDSLSYSVHGGFWQSFLIPTAAAVSVAGRVMTSDGTPIRGVRLTLFDVQGNARTCISSDFGYYRFDDIQIGQTYFLTATSKQFHFAARAVSVEDAIGDLDLVAIVGN